MCFPLAPAATSASSLAPDLFERPAWPPASSDMSRVDFDALSRADVLRRGIAEALQLINLGGKAAAENLEDSGTTEEERAEKVKGFFQRALDLTRKARDHQADYPGLAALIDRAFFNIAEWSVI